MDYTTTDVLVSITVLWVLGCIVCCSWRLWHISRVVSTAEAEAQRLKESDRGPVPEDVLLQQLERTHHSLRRGRLIFTTEPQPMPTFVHSLEDAHPVRETRWELDELDMVY